MANRWARFGAARRIEGKAAGGYTVGPYNSYGALARPGATNMSDMPGSTPSDASPYQSASAYAGEITSDEKLWAMLAHLAGLLGYVVGLGQYIAPLVIYLLYKDKSKFVAFHALQSLYFQLALLVAWAIVIILAIVTCGVGAVLAAPVAVFALIYGIIAAIRAHNGEWFEYWLVGPPARRQIGA
jgi:uncharacterized Tic20 family protein